MKASDFIAKFLAKKGVKHVFGITGAHIVHIFDSIGKEDGIEYICTNHEQAAAMAADGYARVSGKIGVAISTSGPGATNLMTGIACSYFDSIPILIITGQVVTSQINRNPRLRQLGFQEHNIPDIYKTLTKKAYQITDPKDVIRVFNEAYELALSGRPGPVIIDLPDDIQRSEV